MSDWLHAPLHRLGEPGVFMVTAGTLNKEHFFRGPGRLDLLADTLLGLAAKHGVELEAWTVFSNHYHWVGRSVGDPAHLSTLIREFHSLTSRQVNELDGNRGRKVWFQYWDTALTFQRSYLARLNYVMENPVHHGLVASATDYPWCSAGWFDRHANAGIRRKIKSFKLDRVNVPDAFDPVLE